MGELTSKEASEKYDLSAWRIVTLAKEGRIKGRRFGHAWAIDEESLADYVSKPHKPGRQRKRPSVSAEDTGAPPPKIQE